MLKEPCHNPTKILLSYPQAKVETLHLLDGDDGQFYLSI